MQSLTLADIHGLPVKVELETVADDDGNILFYNVYADVNGERELWTDGETKKQALMSFFDMWSEKLLSEDEEA